MKLDEDPGPPWEGAILAERRAHCKVYGPSAVNCAKTAEPIGLRLGCGLGWAEGSTCSIVFARRRQCTQVQSYSRGANVRV